MKSTDEYVGEEIGNYRVGARVANGGFGSVYYGHHKLLPRSVAIKVLHTTYLTSEKEQHRFLREAQLLEKLKHPHCLPVYDVGVLSVEKGGVSYDIPYFISKYAVKGSLRDRLDKSHGPLSLSEVLAIVSQVAEALHYAHQQNVVHRDLKPENILFDEHDNAMLADFGLALVLQMAKTQPASIAGTPGYMAPEQYHGKVSRKSDQYALGCIVYEMLTGHLPHNSSKEHLSLSSSQEIEVLLPPSIYNPHIHPELEQVLLKTLQQQREQRYTDVAAFLQAFRASFASPLLPINTLSQASNQAEIRSQQTFFYWIEEGHKLFRHQHFKEALDAYQKAIHFDSESEEAFLGKAEALIELKRYQDASIAYEQVLAINGSSFRATFGKANVLVELRKYKKALQMYAQAIRLCPNNVDAYLGKENALMELKRYAEALVVCNYAIELDPNYARSYNCRGCAFIKLEKYQEALNDFEYALQLDVMYSVAYENKGIVLENLGYYEEALAAYEQALSLTPYDANLYCYKGYVLCRLREYGYALTAFRQAILLSPDSAAAHLGISDVLFEQKYFEEALEVCERAIHFDAMLAAAYDRKGHLLEMMGRVKEAQEAFKRAKQLGFYE